MGTLLSCLELNDLIEVSCVCKDFYRLSRINSFYVKKLNESRQMFRNRSWIFSSFSSFCDIFYCRLFRTLLPYVPIDGIIKVRKIIEQKLYNAILPFCVWNHLFLCVGSQYESNMCLFCTKIYLRNKKLSRLINKNLTLDVLKHFPSQLSYGIISGGCVNLFVHSSVIDRQKVFDESANFGTLFYEVINSPFMLLKFYLHILAGIIFNCSYKYILPALLSGFKDDCRKHIVCTASTCFGLNALKFSKELAEHSCMCVNSYYIIDVFNNYK